MIELFGAEIDGYIFAILIFVIFQLSRVILRKAAYHFVQKTSNDYDDEVLEAIKKPVDFLFIVVGAKFAKLVLVLNADMSSMIDKIIGTGFIIVLFWAFVELLNYFAKHLDKITNKFGDKLSEEVANFILKSVRLFIIAIGISTILQEWGYNITGFLASLGLVGMAFALAAKDTAANLFGSLVIFTDKPFKVGDWIKTPDVEGTIELIGIRSSKVRTFAQAQVTVPNASLANSAILNWSRMGKRRIKMNIGLTYNTKGETVQKIVDDIKVMLEKHPDIHQDTIHVYFSAFGDSSLNIFCYYFTKTTAWGEFMKVRENTYLEIMKIVEKNGSSFAFPSQSIYIENNKEELI
ncbi:MAG: mechanosensitive ion channel family protein [Arcobacteraceae bacterium]|nr:mechanosensitive ion channel family protein [Arcobacteraceae bacterium]